MVSPATGRRGAQPTKSIFRLPTTTILPAILTPSQRSLSADKGASDPGRALLWGWNASRPCVLQMLVQSKLALGRGCISRARVRLSESIVRSRQVGVNGNGSAVFTDGLRVLCLFGK